MTITGKVLHLDQEMSRDQTFKRYQRMINAADYQENHINITRAKLLKLYDGTAKTLDEIRTELAEVIRTKNYGLVIIELPIKASLFR